jgi:DNA-binding beta-propeller fold protein YncE
VLPAPPGGWIDPSDVAVAPDGAVLVLDAGGFIARYTSRDRLDRVLDLRPLGVYNPRGLAAGPDEILLADTGGGRVLVLDHEGQLQGNVGRPGKGAGELSDPVDVARDGEGGVVVVDASNGRVQRFRPHAGVDSWRRPGERPGSMAERVEADADGAVWVGGGGAPELWRLAPGAGPERHALPPGLAPDGLSRAGRLIVLTASDPARVVWLDVP